MSDNKKPDKVRRNLVVATSVLGGSATVGAEIPFVASMLHSEREKPDWAPSDLDTSGIKLC